MERMTLRGTLLTLALGIGLLAGSTARADDVAPPDWRGSPLSLYAHWGFDDGSPSSQANPSHNDFNRHPSVVVGGTAGPVTEPVSGRKGWVLADPSGISGAMPGIPTGTISTVVPNANRPGAKEIFVQVTYLESAGKPRVEISGFTKKSESLYNADADGRPPYSVDRDRSNPWEVHTSTWTAATCPASETVTIKPPPGGIAVIDQLVIDTICRTASTIS